MLELDQAEQEYAVLADRADALLGASRAAYDRAQKAAEHLRLMQQRVDSADDLDALAEAVTFRDSAERLVEIETRTAFSAAQQHAAAETDAQAADARLRALTAALPASGRAGDVLGGPAAPNAGDPLPAADEED